MWAEPYSGCATMSYLPSLYCFRSTGLFLAGREHARQVDLVELHPGLVRGFDLRLDAVGLPGRGFERVGELEAERGERLGVGLLGVAAGERAVGNQKVHSQILASNHVPHLEAE